MRLICCSFADSAYIQGETFFNETVDKITGGEFSLSGEGIIEFLISAVTEQISELTYYIVILSTGNLSLLICEFPIHILDVIFY